MGGGKASFPRLFTVICLTVIVGITVSVSVLFFIIFRSQSYKQIETNTSESLNHLRDKVVDRFREWSELITYVSIGAAPFMATEPADTQALLRLFSRSMAVQSEIWHIYGTNNLVWNQPGGYVVYGNGSIPSADWDNTTRNWFIGAKENPGKVAYADPYIADSNGKLTTAISTNVYDEQGQDVGVVSGNVSIDFLNELLRESAFVPGQNTYFLNQEGLFITHQDIDAV
ncbi:MAG: cache domain-containing protein, partial [Treponema sp.]|nr:cache domain-containing protein [Treponema sp.]